MTTRLIYILAALLAFFPIQAAATVPGEEEDIAYYRKQKTMHFTDTLDFAREIREFEIAVQIAPTSFVSDSCQVDGQIVTFTGLKLNPTIDRALETEVVKSDPDLEKRIRRLRGWTRPFGAACDLKVSYNYMENGNIYVEYDLTRIRLFVFK